MFAWWPAFRWQRAGPAAGSPGSRRQEGVSFIWHQPLFRWLILITFVGMFFSQSYNQIMPVFADLLDSGETGFGYLLSAGGVGSVAGTLLMGGIQRYRHLGALMLGSAGLAALLAMTFAAPGAGGWFAAALLAVFVAALFASVFMISSMTVLQLSVPDRLRGRVMGIHTMGFSLMPLGGLLLGALAERLGAAPAVWIGCAVYLAVVALIAVRKPLIRGQLNGQEISESHSRRRTMMEPGKWLMAAGIVLLVIGLLVQTGALGWFGRLPGDIRIERPGSSFYFPITSMIVVSVVLSVLLGRSRASSSCCSMALRARACRARSRPSSSTRRCATPSARFASSSRWRSSTRSASTSGSRVRSGSKSARCPSSSFRRCHDFGQHALVALHQQLRLLPHPQLALGQVCCSASNCWW
jgi:MFS family permease